MQANAPTPVAEPVDLAELLPIERVQLDGDASSKKRALELVSESMLQGVDGISDEVRPSAIFDAFLTRERLGSTGLGHGVAIPHGRLTGNEQTLAAFVRLEAGVDFDASDQKPVDLIFALLVPEHSTDAHLQILASLARRFSDVAFCESLREAASAEQIQRLLIAGPDGG